MGALSVEVTVSFSTIEDLSTVTLDLEITCDSWRMFVDASIRETIADGILGKGSLLGTSSSLAIDDFDIDRSWIFELLAHRWVGTAGASTHQYSSCNI